MGKYGSFPSNLILSRPYHLSFEIQDKPPDRSWSDLRIVPASELHAEKLVETAATPSETQEEGEENDDDNASRQPELPAQSDTTSDADALVQNNRLTVDDPSRQALSMEEIEELKKSASGSGRDIVAKILESHSALGEKTAFSLAKYALRKSRKYMRRFTVLPLDVSLLAQWMLHEKEPGKIMEMREETLGLMASLCNVHCGVPASSPGQEAEVQEGASGRWLVVDDTGGLLVAMMAERMGILYPNLEDETPTNNDPARTPEHKDPEEATTTTTTNHHQPPNSPPNPRKRKRPLPTFPRHNTLTLLHPASQPNISLLSYFLHDPSTPSPLPTPHPLSTHLKTLSFLQLLTPHLSPLYHEPPPIPADHLATLKTRQRGSYHRKRRRWDLVRSTVDEARAGGFDGLAVASLTEPFGILRAAVPLLRGGAPVVLYSPDAERLAEVVDAYSSGRKTAFLNAMVQQQQAATRSQTDHPHASEARAEPSEKPEERWSGASVEAGVAVPSHDFPVDPRLLLGPTLQTVRAREWQVLPGRTHPVMTGRGGAEGFVFCATRVLPVEGKPTARGKFARGKGGGGGGGRKGEVDGQSVNEVMKPESCEG